MPRLHLACCFALGLAATPVLAAPCAGFADVADTDTACASVEWLRNRGITTGCNATQYCPTSPVTRAAMALFMNRLGAALTPQLGFVELSLAAVDPDASPVVCPTTVTAATSYPRQALVSAAFAGLSGGDLGFAIRPVASSDGGTTWQPLGSVTIREQVAGATWGTTSVAGVASVPAGQSIRFAVRVERESGSADFTQARCQVAASVMNANGTASPFDVALAPH
jgi:hypothetical protein